MYQIFDPLHFLQRNLKCQVVLDKQGEVRLSFAFKQQQPTILKARKVLQAYRGLLKFQLENGGASVRKLMAQGKLKIEGGRFYRIGAVGIER
jgi:hypothetical protein